MEENENQGVSNVAQPVDQGAPKTYDVFISYRREGGLDLARSIAYWFRAHGFKCFIDQTEMRTGQFNHQIYHAIEDTHYFLLLLSEHALNRCCNEGDWVRIEIEHAREKKVPIVPFTPLPDVAQALSAELPPTLRFLRDTECWQFDRQKNFESTLQEMVKRQMPLFKERVNFAEKDKEDRLYRSIRFYKRNDGTIDDKEHQQLVKEARGYGIEERLQNMINLVESEWNDEQKFIEWAVGRFRLTEGKLSKADMEEIQAQAVASNIAPDRQGELLIEIEQKIRQNETKKEHDEVATQLKTARADKEKLAKQLDERESESEKRRKKCFVLSSILLFVLLLVPLAWWYGKGAGDGEASRRMESEMEQMKAEVAKAKEDASREKTAAESSKQDAERIVGAEKRAADALRACERAEKETEEAKSKLLAANKATAAVEAARQEAEKQLADAKAHAEKRRAEALATIEAERTARKDAEVKSAETAAELNLAKEKIQQLETEMDRLQKAHDQVQKDLDDIRRRRNDEIRNL